MKVNELVGNIAVLQDMLNGATQEQWIALRAAMDALLQVKAFEDAEQDRWISVEKRLPEKNDRYLVTFASKTVSTSTWNKETFRNFGFDMDMIGVGEDNKLKRFGVIAWQPLPEPYGGAND